MSQDPEKPNPSAVPTISYQTPETKRFPRTGYQLLIGALSFFAWLLLVVTVGALINNSYPAGINLNTISVFVGIALLGLFMFCFDMHRRGWKAFFPGVLIALGLSVLVGCGLCAVAIKNI